jgi:CubicO group peptidase (beta-lactamase class C family)
LKIVKQFLILVLLFTSLVYTQNKVDVEKLDKRFQEAVDEFDLIGLAVGIIKNGEIVLAKGYGVKETGKSDKVDTQTLFGIASLSKAFTVACIGMLVDEKKLDWNDKVIDHLPWLKLSDNYVTNELRIVDLLTHRAGYNTFDGDLLWYGTNYTSEEIVKRFRLMPAKKSFRIGYGYSNLMFIVAGLVIEEVTGKSWHQFVKERIFLTLGMQTTNTSTSEFNENSNYALPHLKKTKQEILNYDSVGPAASINSNVDDLLKWLKFWLNRGKVNNEELLSEESIDFILTSQTALNGGKGDKIDGSHFSNVACGWFLSDYAGRKIIAHGGGLPGFISRITFVPEDNLGIIVLTNDEGYIVTAVVNTILNTYLKNNNEEDRFEKLKERLKKREERKEKQRSDFYESRVENTKPSMEFEKYAGAYEDKMYGKAEIGFDNNELTLRLLPAEKLFTSKMMHWHYDTFKIKFKDPFLPEGLVIFSINKNGKVESFKIDLPNPDFHFYNYFFKKID